ncbi:hypothetical protein J132_06977 [Termitomyces sp. J132]|nr:hypothetical protein J132_06977 [Termitomyces sp. J132]
MNNEVEVKIHSDRSGHGGKIGAVVVLYRRFRREVKFLRECLGSDKDHTVFEGECVDTSVGTDNQVGMQALQATGQGMARYLVDEVLKGIQKVRKIDKHMRIKVYWTPGHMSIPENKRADKEVKKTAEGDKTETKGLRTLHEILPSQPLLASIQQKGNTQVHHML